MKKHLTIAAGLLALLAVMATFAAAQVPGLFIASPTGLEQINVLVPSSGTIVTNPQIQTVTINQIRNSEGYILVAAGTTVNTTIPNTASLAIATGAITTWNVTLPLSPQDGQIVKITCPGGATTTLNVSATSPQTIVGASFSSCSATSPTDAAWHYSMSNNVYYRTE
jgi:hypothetical protein